MNASRTVTVASGNLIVGGVISGSGDSLTKAGPGTLTLTAANTYGGPTAVTGGTLSLTPYALLAANPSFETPNLSGGYQYDPAGATWTFVNYSGIAAAGSGFGPPTPIPNGSQVAFVQAAGNTGSFSQIVNFTTSGSYVVSFQGAESRRQPGALQRQRQRRQRRLVHPGRQLRHLTRHTPLA